MRRICIMHIFFNPLNLGDGDTPRPLSFLRKDSRTPVRSYIMLGYNRTLVRNCQGENVAGKSKKRDLDNVGAEVFSYLDRLAESILRLFNIL